MSEKFIAFFDIILETSTLILISIGGGSGCDRGGIGVYKSCQLQTAASGPPTEGHFKGFKDEKYDL